MRGPIGLLTLLLVLSCSSEHSAKHAPSPAPAAKNAHVVRATPRPTRAQGEHRRGGSRWRDAGVYVDGHPVGVLWFGELPESLEPVWIDEQVSLDFKPGDPGPHTKTVKVRRYRLRDYLAAVGVPLGRIKMVHIYGGIQFVAGISGRELRRVGDRLYFGFGSGDHGKPLIYFPPDIHTNTSFDHIGAIAVYVTRKPPQLTKNGEVRSDGKPVSGIPYYGQPLRGGIRVYKDDRLAAWIKRRLLKGQDKLATRVGDQLRWQLLPYLKSLGVATGDVVRAEVVFDERRVGTLSRAELEQTFFTASPRARGQILLGPRQQPVQALALFSHPAGGKK